MKDETYLFVSCPFGGTKVFMMNLRAYVLSRGDVSSRWVDIPRPSPSDGDLLGKIIQNWTLRASYLTYSAIRNLRRVGTTVKAVFFNHLTAASMLPLRQKTPCILSLDTTPVLLNRDWGWYRQEGFQTRGLLERASQMWTRRTYAAMRYLLPWSQYARDSLVDDYGVASDRVIVTPPSIDLSSWKPGPCWPDRGSRQLSVLFVGGDFVRKGGDLLVQLAAAEAFREIDFHFVTKSFSGPRPRNVHVHTDLRPNSDALMNLYRSCDVFALPTRADYAPTNAVVEAFASGLPLITTDVGGLEGVVHEGIHGFVVPRNGVEALGMHLLHLTSNPILLRGLKLNARRYAERHFDINRTGTKIIDLLREVGEKGTTA
jgi:glycosyltransferase involved in cell wall biosynthesis